MAGSRYAVSSGLLRSAIIPFFLFQAVTSFCFRELVQERTVMAEFTGNSEETEHLLQRVSQVRAGRWTGSSPGTGTTCASSFGCV